MMGGAWAVAAGEKPNGAVPLLCDCKAPCDACVCGGVRKSTHPDGSLLHFRHAQVRQHKHKHLIEDACGALRVDFRVVLLAKGLDFHDGVGQPAGIFALEVLGLQAHGTERRSDGDLAGRAS